MAPEKRKKTPADRAKQAAKRARGNEPAVTTKTIRAASTETQAACVGSLLGPHEATIAKLQPKYNVLAASVISSSQIRRRVSYVTNHLVASKVGEKAPPATTIQKSSLVLLHARPADVCKLITVVEQCKRVLKEEGKAFYQYNQLFQLPPPTQKPDVVEETVLPGNDDQDSEEEEEEDAFEPLGTRLDKALQPPQRTHASKSMRIFLSCTPVPELKAEPGTTVQASETSAASPA